MSGDTSSFLVSYEGITNTNSSNLTELRLNGQLITSLQNIPFGNNTYDILQWDASLQQYVVIPNTKIVLGKDSVSTHNNTIMLNATGGAVPTDDTNRLYIAPIRNAQSNAGFLLYNFSTKEVSYSLTVPTFTTSGLTISTLNNTNPNRLVVSNGSKQLISSSYNEAQLGILSNAQTWTAQNTFSSSIVLAVGSAGAPSLRFDSDSGIYSTGDGNVSISTNSTLRLGITDRIRPYGVINSAATDGSASKPNYSFETDSDTGMYQSAGGNLDFSTNAVQRLNITTTINPMVVIRNISGTTALPCYSFTQNSSTGMYQGATVGEINFSCNNNDVLKLSTSGVIIPTLTADKLVLTNDLDRLVSSSYAENQLGILPNTQTWSGINTFSNTVKLSNLIPTKLLLIDNNNNIISSDYNITQLPKLSLNNTFTGTNTFNTITMGSGSRLELASGTALNPSLIFTGGGAYTGIWSGVLNTIRISTNGTTRCTITDSGLSIANLTNLTVGATKIVLSDTNKNLISSAYTDTDMFIKTLNNIISGDNTFSGNNIFSDNNDFTGALNFFNEMYCQDIRVNSGVDGFLAYFQPTTKYLSSYDPLDLPVSTATTTAINSGLALKLNIADPECTGRLRVPLGGTITTPTITFTTDLDTGIYASVANTIDYTCGATQVFKMSNASITSYQPIRTSQGGVASPAYSFIEATNSGIYSSPDTLNMSVNGVRHFRINTTGDVFIGTGAQAGIIYPFISGGIYIGNNAGNSNNKTGTIFTPVAIGYQAAQKNQGGYTVAIGRDAGRYNQGDYAVAIGYGAGQGVDFGQGQHSNTIIINATTAVLNSTAVNRCYIAPVRPATSPLTAVQYNTTTKELVTYSSSRRLKKNIESKKNFNADDILKLNIVEFDSIEDDTHNPCGLIAEECYDINPEFVCLDGEGLPISINYFTLMLYSIEKNKQQEIEIQSLKTTIANMKTKMDENVILQRLEKMEAFLNYKFNF